MAVSTMDHSVLRLLTMLQQMCVFKIGSIKTRCVAILWAVKPEALPRAWNHKDNAYFLPASYLEHMISTYSTVTDAVICRKCIAFWVVYCDWLSIIMCCFCVYHRFIMSGYQQMFLKCMVAWYCINFYLEVTGSWRGSLDPLLYWGVTGSVIP